MTTSVQRTFVSAVPPTSRRAGAGGRPCQGIYHTPSGRQPSVAAIATHYEIDFSEHYLAEFLAAEEIGFLGWNTRYRGAGAYFLLEHALLDIDVGVRWLREEAGVETVVLLGNSGGASLMSAYQSQARSVTIDATPGRRLPGALDGLVGGDAFIALNAHPGRPQVLTRWLDPSVTDEQDPLSVDPTRDMFDPTNGPPYAAEFVERYRSAQRDRNQRITAWVHDELARLEDHGATDRIFTVHRTWADLRFLDLTLDPSDRAEGCYLGDPRRANYGPLGVGRTSTLRTWLSMWSLEDSHCDAGPHLARIDVPALVVQSTADRGCFPSDARTLYEALASEDARLELVAGGHYLRTPDTARADVAQLLAGWIREHT